MKLLTAHGDYASAPLALDALKGDGVLAAMPESIELVPGPGGEARRQRYANIYRTNPWVWAAVQLPAKGVSRLPVHVFNLESDGERSRVRSDVPSRTGRPTGPEALDRLLRRSEPGVSTRKWLERTMIDKGIYHNALTEIVRDGGLVVGLRRHPWAKVKPHLSDDRARILFYELPDKRKLLPEEGVILLPKGDG